MARTICRLHERQCLCGTTLVNIFAGPLGLGRILCIFESVQRLECFERNDCRDRLPAPRQHDFFAPESYPIDDFARVFAQLGRRDFVVLYSHNS